MNVGGNRIPERVRTLSIWGDGNIEVNFRGIIRGVSKKFGEWYQRTNKTEDTN
jgi:hypothetical protein